MNCVNKRKSRYLRIETSHTVTAATQYNCDVKVPPCIQRRPVATCQPPTGGALPLLSLGGLPTVFSLFSGFCTPRRRRRRRRSRTESEVAAAAGGNLWDVISLALSPEGKSRSRFNTKRRERGIAANQFAVPSFRPFNWSHGCRGATFREQSTLSILKRLWQQGIERTD